MLMPGVDARRMDEFDVHHLRIEYPLLSTALLLTFELDRESPSR